MRKTYFSAMLIAALSCAYTPVMQANTAEGSSPSSVAADQKVGTCTGTVIDEIDEPLTGASVVVEGAGNGTSTDIDGKFSISNVKVGSKIRVSFVGYDPVTVTWTGTPLSIQLKPNATALDEVVVVGFGTQKKVNLTGAVSTISAKEIAARPVNSVADALQGMAAGLDVLGSSLGGQLNGTRTMNIRGTGSIGTGSDVTPLVLIDGMEGDLNSINPQDVENISILKDAAASSIYGSRAAGGVILVTTKNGKEGKVTVNYSDSFRWSHVVGMAEMMNSYEWANYMNQASLASGVGAWFSEEKLNSIKEAVKDPSKSTMFVNPNNNRWEVWDLTSLLPTGNTDWLKEHFGKTAFSQEHNISATGGNEKYNFYFSGNYLGQEGILRYGDDNQQRYIINGRININFTKWLSFGYSARWYRNDYDSPSVMGEDASNILYHNFSRYWPIVPTHDPNGYPVVESYIDALENGGRYKKNTDKFDQQFVFRFRPLEGMNINAEFNYRTESTNTKRYGYQCYGWDADGIAYERNPDDWWAGAPTGSRVYEKSYRSNYFNPNIYGDYSRTFADVHNFKIMAGFQSEWYSYKEFYAQRTDIASNLPYLDTTTGTMSMGGGPATWSTAGWFGRINYDYDGRYLVEGNIRYDGSSRFRRGSRWTTSPSFSLGWNIAREKFWEDFIPYCNTLKLRFSWGKLGNQNTNSWYPTYAVMTYYGSGNSWLVNGKKPAYGQIPGLISPTLTWEKNRTWDIGLDFGLFNNRLTGTFDYYNRRTQDMVGPGEVLPDILGTDVPNVNNLNMTSKGWELSISWRDRIGEVNYGITANLYDHTITIDDYPNPFKDFSVSNYYSGAKLGDIWGYTTIGIAKTQEEMNAHLDRLDAAYTAKHGHAPAEPRRGQARIKSDYAWGAGDIMYADLNGDGIISNGENTAGDRGDMTVIGNNTPRYNFGLNLEASWRGFDVKVFFQGTMKRDYWASGPMMFGASGIGKWQAVGYKPHLDYFRAADTTDPLGPNVDAYYPRANWGGGEANTQVQTRYLQNAAYCRLKNVTIGYTVPKVITQKASIDNLRVYVSGENLANITNFTGTGDPELIEAYDKAYGYGKVYPLQRVFSVGLNVTF